MLRAKHLVQEQTWPYLLRLLLLLLLLVLLPLLLAHGRTQTRRHQ